MQHLTTIRHIAQRGVGETMSTASPAGSRFEWLVSYWTIMGFTYSSPEPVSDWQPFGPLTTKTPLDVNSVRIALVYGLSPLQTVPYQEANMGGTYNVNGYEVPAPLAIPPRYPIGLKLIQHDAGWGGASADLYGYFEMTLYGDRREL